MKDNRFLITKKATDEELKKAGTNIKILIKDNNVLTHFSGASSIERLICIMSCLVKFAQLEFDDGEIKDFEYKLIVRVIDDDAVQGTQIYKKSEMNMRIQAEIVDALIGVVHDLTARSE